MQQSQEYTVGIFGGFYNPDFSGWRHTEPLKINATSLEEAIKTSEEEVSRKLKTAFNLPSQTKIEIIVNYVKNSDDKILYQTAWDETNPLSSTPVDK